VPSPTSIYDCLARTVARVPDAPAVKALENDRYVATSYRRLHERVRAIGTALLALGVRRGEPVGLVSDNRLEWILADLAATSIGAADVPRGSDTPEAELEHIFAHAGCRTAFVEDARELAKLERIAPRLASLERAIVLDPAFQAEREGAGFAVLPLAALEERGRALVLDGDPRFEQAARSLGADDLLTIIYTSGTTGRPKGVELTHGNMLHQIRSLPAAVRATDHDRWLSILPPWHVFERAVEYTCLASGCSTAYAKPQRPSLLRGLELERPTMMAAVPRVLEALYEGIWKAVRREGRAKEGLFRLCVGAGRRRFHARLVLEGRAPDRAREPALALALRRARARAETQALAPLARLAEARLFRKIRARTGGALRAIISGGAALPSHLDEFFHAIGIPVLEGYGLTETSPVVAVRTPGRSAPFTVGHPLPETEIEILDESGAPLPPGKTGRVAIRGPQVMRGYHKDPAASAAALGPGRRLETGDLGYLLPGGELKLTGRAKDLIVLITGEKVEPEPLESRLRRSPLIAQVLVTGQDERQICALIVPNFEALGERLRRPVSASAVEEPEVRAAIKQEIGRVLPEGATKPYERIRRFQLLPTEWKVGEELTATLKLKRDVIRARYQDAIAGAR
jgi:long-chain acyl-CoA synthetase